MTLLVPFFADFRYQFPSFPRITFAMIFESLVYDLTVQFIDVMTAKALATHFFSQLTTRLEVQVLTRTVLKCSKKLRTGTFDDSSIRGKDSTTWFDTKNKHCYSYRLSSHSCKSDFNPTDKS